MDKEVIVKDNTIYASVTVENIYDMDRRDDGSYSAEEYNFPIELIDRDIYMVFATDKYEKGMEHPEELQRDKFTIRFK